MDSVFYSKCCRVRKERPDSPPCCIFHTPPLRTHKDTLRRVYQAGGECAEGVRVTRRARAPCHTGALFQDVLCPATSSLTCCFSTPSQTFQDSQPQSWSLTLSVSPYKGPSLKEQNEVYKRGISKVPCCNLLWRKTWTTHQRKGEKGNFIVLNVTVWKITSMGRRAGHDPTLDLGWSRPLLAPPSSLPDWNECGKILESHSQVSVCSDNHFLGLTKPCANMVKAYRLLQAQLQTSVQSQWEDQSHNNQRH